MNFTSNIFLIGLLPWIIFLYIVTKKWRLSKKIIIFIANSIFYIWGGTGAFLFVCAFSVIIWFFGKIILNYKNKILFYILICISLVPLLAVKYTGFLIENINNLLNYQIEISNIIIPAGISFFTFEALSLLCDIYLGKINKKVSLDEVYLYLTFFPTVTSGPIIRFDEFKKGFDRSADIKDYEAAIERVSIGLCKKVLIADKIGILADYYFNGIASGNTFSCAGLWIASIAYTLQLYYDFSGYSDMAIGIGKLLGFEIRENFNEPYQAGSISEFWKRWHISLSCWFRDYVYIPLGGNRCSVPRHIINILIVWLLTGIWHGADWSFVIWGLGYFVLLLLEKYVPIMKNIGKHWWGHLYSLFFINLLWIPFRAADLSVAGKYIADMFGKDGLGKIEKKSVMFIPYLTIAILLCFPWKIKLEKHYNRKWFKIIKDTLMVIFVGMAICAVINSSYTPYIYGNF